MSVSKDRNNILVPAKVQATLRLILIYNCAFNSITALYTNAFSYFSCYKRRRSIPVIIRGWKIHLDSMFGTTQSTSYLFLDIILDLHDSKIAPIVKLHCLTTKAEHCKSISSPFSSIFASYLIVYPPPTRHRAQRSQCCGVKYNADETFKANAIWKAGKGEETQLSARHVFFKGCP